MSDGGVNGAGSRGAEPRVGAQLIVFGRRNVEDLPAVLEEVRRAGYDGFECGNLLTCYSPEEVRGLLASSGLAVTGCHMGFGDVADPAKVDSALEFLSVAGSNYMMVSGVGKHEDGIPAYEAAARVFEEAGRRCDREGVTFCYHNHAWEFDVFDGKVAMHYLIAETDPDLVKLCIDVYWVHVGGDDPAEFIHRYADRAVYFHFKDGWKGTFTELGRGHVEYDRVMKEVRAIHPEWIVYEQDRTEIDPFESCRISREFLRDRLSI